MTEVETSLCLVEDGKIVIRFKVESEKLLMTIELTDGIIKEISSKIKEGFNLWSYDFSECSEL